MDTALTGRRAPLLLLLASVLALATAFVAQYGFDLQPCVLCLYQRWPYGVAIVLALAALAAPAYRGWLLALIGLTLLVDAGIAGYHVGVEQHWWAGTDACTGPSTQAKTLEELRAQIMATPVTRCDEVQWSLFGISMAGYNLIACLVLAGFAFVAANKARS
ncbi:MAG: disulfide bond formation protein B [Alphaproteobacteria bacterium]